MQALFDGSGVKVGEVSFNSRIQYLLIELEEGTTREQLEGIKPDYAACLSAQTDDLMLVIVTTKGLTGELALLGSPASQACLLCLMLAAISERPRVSNRPCLMRATTCLNLRLRYSYCLSTPQKTTEHSLQNNLASLPPLLICFLADLS